ncbi:MULTISPECIES: hypothetical protein [Corynebacterium]|uniref:Peptidoglycan binding-like domain-containing protein n=1 Tax=Corynebacterium lehmanniae TaxID=2913497 RepID=A0ABT4R656_9CORY|nr:MULTISPECIES: hypothetical protein [Corynebacterium]MCG7235568.1 hypothetical protein [Corynebacterium sp. ACRQP]MCG7290114.1 hypothetical protein [Corynebacterium sp. ACRPZ]MCG7294730.1 hypothetical protein [Corynebacterium sp. ACRPY]MCZ9291027.1 hypothetical protein [Corynebacterium lehmanniae]
MDKVATQVFDSGNSDAVRRLREFQAAHGIEGGILEDCDGLFDDAVLSRDETELN